jgi:hypothetical protein
MHYMGLRSKSCQVSADGTCHVSAFGAGLKRDDYGRCDYDDDPLSGGCPIHRW